MTSSRVLIRATATSVTALIALTITGCTGGASPMPSASSDAAPSVSSGESSGTPRPSIRAADVTCGSLIPQDVSSAFAASGWTVRDDPFRMGEEELEDGHWCTWGDFSGAASDNVEIYGWAQVEDDKAASAQKNMVGDGWIREEEPSGIVITENPETSVSTDDEGYGITYLFGDGWVIASHTKADLLVIDIPGA